jgi:hypothetical protein
VWFAGSLASPVIFHSSAGAGAGAAGDAKAKTERKGKGDSKSQARSALTQPSMSAFSGCLLVVVLLRSVEPVGVRWLTMTTIDKGLEQHVIACRPSADGKTGESIQARSSARVHSSPQLCQPRY